VARSSSPAPTPFPLSFAAALAVAALCATTGCAPAATASGPGLTFNPCAQLTLVPDPTASDVQMQGVTAGAALWNGIAGSELFPGTASATGPAVPIHFQAAAAPFHGLYDPPSGQIYINDDLSGQELAITIAHEVGHSFGLVHISPDVRPSLMNPGNLTVLPTAADVSTLADIWGRCGSLDAAGTE
jgi:hypothetical protein